LLVIQGCCKENGSYNHDSQMRLYKFIITVQWSTEPAPIHAVHLEIGLLALCFILYI